MNDKKNLMRMDKLELIMLLEHLTEENDALRDKSAALEEANAKLTLSAREKEQQYDDLQLQWEQAQERIRTLTETVDLLAAGGSTMPAAVETPDVPEPWQAQTQPYGTPEMPTPVEAPAERSLVSPAPQEVPVPKEEPAPAVTVAIPDDIPLGSFAEAMVQVHQLVERTQQAADEYMARCRAEYGDSEANARRIMAEAQDEASRIVADARQQADTLTRDAAARRAELDAQEQTVRNRLRDEIAQLNRFVQALDRPAGEDAK